MEDKPKFTVIKKSEKKKEPNGNLQVAFDAIKEQVDSGEIQSMFFISFTQDGFVYEKGLLGESVMLQTLTHELQCEIFEMVAKNRYGIDIEY